MWENFIFLVYEYFMLQPFYIRPMQSCDLRRCGLSTELFSSQVQMLTAVPAVEDSGHFGPIAAAEMQDNSGFHLL